MAQQRWTNAFLDQMRQTGDPLADHTVQTLFEQGEVDAVNRLLANLIRNDQMAPADLPPVLRDYLEQSAVLPDWADPKRIKQGEELFRDYGLIAFSLLGCASLPACYSAGDAAKVLWLTQRLEQHVTRRLVETTQMVIDVMSGGGLQPGGKGIRAAQKVRLMHAAIRHLVLMDPQAGAPGATPKNFADVLISHPWKKEEWGLPINQSVMTGTLLTFSYVILRGLRTFGVELKPEQEEAYLHTWNVVGHVMGVHEEFLVNAMTYPDAERLFETILQRNRAEGPEAKALMHALLNFMEGTIKRKVPLGNLVYVRHIPKMLILELMGEDTARLLGVSLDWRDRLAQVPLALWMRVLGRTEEDTYADLTASHRLAEWLFRKMAEDMWELPRGGERDLFYIPTHLATSWGVGAA
jgi:hypothetical protein